MSELFLEKNYFDFLEFKELKSETQTTLNSFCNYYLNNYKGTDKENLEYLRLFFTKFLKNSKKDSIFLSVFNGTLKINVYDFNIDFVDINESLESLNTFINEFKNFLEEF